MDTAIRRELLAPPSGRVLGVTATFLTFGVFYIFAFPKAGIKLYGVPITFGYVLTGVLALVALLRAERLALPLDRLLAYGTCLLLGLWSAFVVNVNGTESVGFTLSYFISVLYLPAFGLIFFSGLVLDQYGDWVERAFLWAIRFIVAYGIFLFLFKQLTGQWIEIPYLTVNADDVGTLDDKYINRGGVFKLISTYNNGNIFGVSMCILTPLYLRLEPRRALHYALYLALFLTLSRTVWIGIILIMTLRALSNGLRPVTLLYLGLGGLVAAGMIYFLLYLLGRDLSFIFDRNLGGRAYLLAELWNIRFIPDEITGALPEIVYIGMAVYFGVPGLLLFVLHLTLPALLLLAEGVPLRSRLPASACVQGLVIYPILSLSDAAFSFIPVMMVFWTVAGLGFWHAHRSALVGERPR